MAKNTKRRKPVHHQVSGKAETLSAPPVESEVPTEHEQALREAAEDNKHKAASIRSAAYRFPDLLDQEQGLALANRLDPELGCDEKEVQEPPESAASSVSVAKAKLQYGSALERVFSEEEEGIFAFRVYPRGWRYSVDHLTSAEAPDLLETIAHTFHAVGIDDTQGILWGGLRGEYDPLREHFRICLSGIASSGIAKLISGLKVFPRFKDPDDPNELWDQEHWNDPIGVRAWAKPVADVSTILPSLFSTDWSQRPTIFDENGNVKRLVDLRPIPQPFASHALLWLDRWELAQITMAIGLGDFEDGLGRAHGFSDY